MEPKILLPISLGFTYLLQAQANVQVSLCPWQAISHLAPDTFSDSLYFLSLMLTNFLHSYHMYTFSGMKFLHFIWIISAFLKLQLRLHVSWGVFCLPCPPFCPILGSLYIYLIISQIILTVFLFQLDNIFFILSLWGMGTS